LAYDVARNGTTVAELLHVVEHNARTYQITKTWKGRGLLSLRGTAVRTSRGMIGPDGLKPLELAAERTGRSTARATCDWQAKISRGTEDERTDIWLAADLSYLPVRILVVEKNGTRYDQVATKISTQ